MKVFSLIIVLVILLNNVVSEKETKNNEIVNQIIAERQNKHDQLNERKEWDSSYDFIVVGAGTAGAIVAARLAEDRSKTVLVIEAGGPQTVRSDIPAFQQELLGSPLDWNYTMVSQSKAFQAFIGNKYPIQRGKAFGGCSMHNDMNYYRENPEYWNMWKEMAGVENWSWSHVLPYFLKSENNLDPNIVANNTELHRTGGPLSITTVENDAIFEAYMKASPELGPELGYPITYTDGRKPFGSAIMQRNVLKGVRQSTSLVFLEGNDKQNLHILGETHVTKVLFNDNKRAIGVQFSRENESHSVFARNEVILSAGTPGTPHLLLLSGIGPKDHLQKMGVSVISDLGGVGEIQSDLYVTIKLDIKDQASIDKPIETDENFYNYFVEGKGPLTRWECGTTCLKDVHYPGHPEVSNGVILPRVALMGSDLEALVKGFKLKDEWRQYYRPYLNHSYVLILADLKHPQGRGSIRLSSKNPFVYPVIDPCTFCVEQDFNDLVKVTKATFDFFTSPAMSEVVENFKYPIPGCTPCDGDYFCQSYLECLVRSYTGGIYPTSGSRIGVSTDPKAVVDERLRVFGVSGLRVIDASILPIGGDQTFGITMMIGEYGADMIKEDNRMPRE